MRNDIETLGDRNTTHTLELTVKVVSAYVSKNALPRIYLPEVIVQVHQSLSALSGGQHKLVPLVPAVPIKKSVTPDHIISLEDGRRFKSMKRHLSMLGMTPDQYREKWGLPRDYPMVAPNYAERRSQLAKNMGLGRKAGDLKPKQARRELRPMPLKSGNRRPTSPQS
jgi:predicted transcriptional regulator